MKIFDISPNIMEAEVYSGDILPELTWVSNIEDGEEYNLTNVKMCTHTGAHIDAPFHFVDDGKTVGEMPPSQFVGRCIVAEAEGPITGEWVEKNMPWNCTRLIIKCGGKAFLMENAVHELCRFNLKLVGIDALSVASEDNEGAVHRELMFNNIAILEGIKLDGVKAGEYFLFAPPINLGEAEAAPCRALLIQGIIATETD